MTWAKQRDAGRAAELRPPARTIAEADPRTRQRPNRAICTNRDDAPAFVGDVHLAIGSDGNTDWLEEPIAVRPRRRRHAPVRVDGPDDGVSGIGDIDQPVRVD